MASKKSTRSVYFRSVRIQRKEKEIENVAVVAFVEHRKRDLFRGERKTKIYISELTPSPRSMQLNLARERGQLL